MKLTEVKYVKKELTFDEYTKAVQSAINLVFTNGEYYGFLVPFAIKSVFAKFYLDVNESDYETFDEYFKNISGINEHKYYVKELDFNEIQYNDLLKSIDNEITYLREIDVKKHDGISELLRSFKTLIDDFDEKVKDEDLSGIVEGLSKLGSKIDAISDTKLTNSVAKIITNDIQKEKIKK